MSRIGPRLHAAPLRFPRSSGGGLVRGPDCGHVALRGLAGDPPATAEAAVAAEVSSRGFEH